jgi:hypothetical protein
VSKKVELLEIMLLLLFVEVEIGFFIRIIFTAGSTAFFRGRGAGGVAEGKDRIGNESMQRGKERGR